MRFFCGGLVMLDADSLKSLLTNLSPEDKRECLDELSRLEISSHNAEEVYRILQVLETGLDVNLALQVRAVCRKLETQFPGRFSFEFLTSAPVIEHLRKASDLNNQPGRETLEKISPPIEKTHLCPFCAAQIETTARKCTACNNLIENNLCSNCGRHSYQTRFCIWCDSLMSKSHLRRASITSRAMALCVDYALLAASLMAYLHMETGVALPLAYCLCQIYFMTSSSTIGKKTAGLVVIKTSDYDNTGFFQILLRETAGKVISLLCLGIGFFWFFYDEDGQTWHDLMAQSIVVKKND